MSCIRNNVLNSTVRLGTPAMRLSKTCSLSWFSFVHVSALCTSPFQTLEHYKIPRIVLSSPKYKSCTPMCLFGEKKNSRSEKKAFSWDSLKDAVRGLRKEKTVQELLRDQIRQQEFGGDGGDKIPPGSGGGGGSDGTEDEGFAGSLDETLQVFMATTAFIILYIYIIRGEELTFLTRDYIKYLFGGVPSSRLERIMDKWKRKFNKFSWTEEGDDWLARRIVTTPTWWHRPEELARMIKSKKMNGHGRN